MMNTFSMISIGSLVLLLTGCGTTAAHYRPIVDGVVDGQYETDLSACSHLAESRSYINDDVKSEALLGAITGGVLGAIDEGTEGALAGVVIGGLLTGGERSWETREERKRIVISCMQQRGHRVVG